MRAAQKHMGIQTRSPPVVLPAQGISKQTSRENPKSKHDPEAFSGRHFTRRPRGGSKRTSHCQVVAKEVERED